MTILVPQPQPLATCPGRAVWERYRGEDWLVFADESFFMFFELTAKTGYFCHATVGIPEREYASLKASLGPILQDFVKLTGQSLNEFKHSEFKRLAYRERRKLALRLRDALQAHGAFVGGFYTPVRAFVLEHVRFNLMGDAEEIPEQHQDLYDKAADELRAAHKGPGQSGVISKLLWLPVVGVANLLASFGCGYRIIYDPREKKEDKVVRASAADLIAATSNLKKVPDTDLRDDLADYFRGIEIDRPSDQEVGLQVADLMVGEVCEFFKANGDLMSYAATPRLVTQSSQERVNPVTQVGGQIFKTGVLYKMPRDLQQRFHRADPGERTVLPFFRNVLAAGMLTCYSAYGQPRDLMLFEGLIFDQCD